MIADIAQRIVAFLQGGKNLTFNGVKLLLNSIPKRGKTNSRRIKHLLQP